MSIDVVEAMLEAQYMRLIARSIADVYGDYTFQFYKPSAQDEVFLGFDQAWVRIASIPAAQMYRHIRDVLAGAATNAWYWAFFLQFKRVERISRNSDKMKKLGIATPYYRSEISLKPNKRTNKSQHEILKELSLVPASEVYYACPMMFSRDDVYRDPDPDDLRLVELNGAPAGYLANQTHHIVFQSKDDPNPKWCSEPTRGKSIALPAWIKALDFKHRFNAKGTAGLLDTIWTMRKHEIVRPDYRWSRHERNPRSVGGGFGGGNFNNDDLDFDDGYSPTGAPMSLVIVKAEERADAIPF